MTKISRTYTLTTPNKAWKQFVIYIILIMTTLFAWNLARPYFLSFTSSSSSVELNSFWKKKNKKRHESDVKVRLNWTVIWKYVIIFFKCQLFMSIKHRITTGGCFNTQCINNWPRPEQVLLIIALPHYPEILWHFLSRPWEWENSWVAV